METLVGRTVWSRAGSCLGEPGLLVKVHIAWDIWSVGAIGPWLSPRVRYRLDVYKWVVKFSTVLSLFGSSIYLGTHPR